MKTLLKFIFFIAILIFLTLITAGLGMVYLNEKINEPVNFSQEVKEFEIKQGQGAKEIAKNLQTEGIIVNNFYFTVYLWEIGQGNKLKAGKYSIKPTFNIKDIVSEMISGDVIKNEIQITIPEGFNLRDIDRRLSDAKIISELGLLNFNYLLSGIYKNYDFLNENCDQHCSLEGYLFPDTYRFSADKLPIGTKEVMGKFLDNFEKKTKNFQSQAKLKNIDFRDIVIMASIIEREVRTPEDMKMVSGVLWNRISIGMPLQVDAPIVYITGKKTGEITYDDLKVDSLYNTYLHKGLPPAPISNPGVNAIDAALNPAKNDYLYYLSKPTGETIFSKTLGDHNRAKNLYLK